MPYKIALIGCGRVGIWLEDDPLRSKPASHLGGILKLIKNDTNTFNKNSISICDLNKQLLEKCCDRWPCIINSKNIYQDYKKLIKKEEPDIIIIASWTSSHRDIAVYAATHGIKGIVLEKPVATNLKQTNDIITTCKKHNVKLVINHERRWGPLYRKTKEIIENKTLGDLKLIYGNVLSQSAPSGRWKEILPKVGGGPLLHDGTHLIDMILFFAGNIRTVSGHVKRESLKSGTETTATACMKSDSGISIFIEAGGMRDYFNFEIDLQFQRGRIKIGNGIKEFFITEDSKLYTGFKDLIPIPFPKLSHDSNPFTGAILEVIKAIEQDTQPFSSGNDGLKTMELIFAIYQSALLNSKMLTLPLSIKSHPLTKMFQKGML